MGEQEVNQQTHNSSLEERLTVLMEFLLEIILEEENANE